ncbi:MAG TPA: hypothetical protein VFB66_02770 [Tepidisphaeraceae bacterium]|nr:hypothetical protein [Tepidisphaeraceae bacterium]
MWVVAVRRWQWVVIGLLVGLAHGSIRQWAASDFDNLLDRHGLLLTDQGEFESALVTKVHGQRRFRDAVVHKFEVSRGRDRRLVHVVSGKYWDGRVVEDGGSQVARYAPACFVAAAPYRPQVVRPGGERREFPSVVEYLASLRPSAGVEFRTDRWGWLREPLFVSPAVGVLLIGVVWPTVVNLVAFRTFRRPPEEQGISLADVKVDPLPKPRETPAESPLLRELEAALAARLADAGAEAETSAAPSPAAAPVRVLATEHAEPSAPADDRSHHEFAARSDDFYPTELHTSAPHPTDHRR